MGALPVRTERLRPRLVALSLGVLAILVFWLAQPLLRSRELSGESLLDPFLQLGTRSWIFAADSQQCLGAITSTVAQTRVAERGEYRLHLQGRFYALPANEVTDLNAELIFNDYRLLTKLTLSLRGVSSHLELAGESERGLAGTVREQGVERALELSFPAGIMLLDKEERGFSLSLPPRVARAINDLNHSAVQFKVVESSRLGVEECLSRLTPESGTALDLSPILGMLRHA